MTSLIKRDLLGNILTEDVVIVPVYVGEHKGDGVMAWLGWAIIRAAQIGRKYRKVTHTEIFFGGTPQSATIGSATLQDPVEYMQSGRWIKQKGGVRFKSGVALNPKHWLILALPATASRNTEKSRLWFQEHVGQKYDKRGAVGAVLYGIGEDPFEWFCNETCGASLGQTDPHTMPPAGFCAWLVDLGAVDVTDNFFGNDDGEPK